MSAARRLVLIFVNSLYKIGISDVSNFEGRMRHLENNGYANVAGLERILAVKTDNYKEKENLLHEIFSKSRTELFAVDENLVKRLFLSLRGEIVFPKNETAESEFEKSVHERRQEGNAGSGRKQLLDLVRRGHREYPYALPRLLAGAASYKPKKSKIRLFKEAYLRKSGTRLTDEIADGIHIYTCFSRADLEKAYSEYLELFKSESDAEGRKPR
ncbi:GIY-YIG nuclease family protein [Neisseria meningitidis]|uniref:GIY-YIG nuclease family protein n=1 Tax=Neisseria meningitidis TaxID=487 RepID=UPI001F34A5D2|nr:GIY-YIG nuclease family protein [Neisseria meningitidis]